MALARLEGAQFYDALTGAVGPDYVWLRLESEESMCLVQMHELRFPPVCIPIGYRSLARSLAAATSSAEEKALELLALGVLEIDDAFRELALTFLEPLTEQIHTIVRSVGGDSSTIRAILFELRGASIPGLLGLLQKQCPNQDVIGFDSLGLPSPEEMPNTLPNAMLADLDAGPPPPPPGIQAPIRALELSNEPTSNAFMAWLGTLGIACVIGGVGFLFHAMRGVDDQLTRVTIELERMRQQQLANMPVQQYQRTPLDNTNLLSLLPVPRNLEGRAPVTLRSQNGGALGAFSDGLTGMEPLDPGYAPPLPNVSHRFNPSRLPHTGAAARTPSLPLIPIGEPTPPRRFLPALPITTPSEATASGSPPGVSPAGGASGKRMPIRYIERKAESGDLALPAITPPVLPDPPKPPDAPAPAGTTMTLAQALQAAAAHSYLMDAAHWRQISDDAIHANAMTPYHLQWGVGGSLSSSGSTNGIGTGLTPVGGGNASIYSSMSIDIAGRKGPIQAAARAAHLAGDAEIDDAREAACFSAANSYFAAIDAAQVVDAERELLAVEQAEWKVVRARVDSGAATRLDLAEASNRIAQSVKDLGQAYASLETTELQLGSAVRAQPGVRVAPDVPQWSGKLRLSSFEQLAPVDLAASRPDVRAALARVTEAKADLALASRSKRPDMRAFGGVGLLNGGVQQTQPYIGVNVTLPLGDGGQSANAIRAAKARLGEMQTVYSNALQNAVTEVKMAQVTLEHAQQKQQAASMSLVAAREAVRVSEDRYRTGYATYTDVVQAEGQFGQALRDSVATTLAVQRASIDLLHVTGRLSPIR